MTNTTETTDEDRFEALEREQAALEAKLRKMSKEYHAKGPGPQVSIQLRDSGELRGSPPGALKISGLAGDAYPERGGEIFECPSCGAVTPLMKHGTPVPRFLFQFHTPDGGSWVGLLCRTCRRVYGAKIAPPEEREMGVGE